MQAQKETQATSAAVNAGHGAAARKPQSAMASVRLVLGALALLLVLGGVFVSLRQKQDAAPQAAVAEPPQTQQEETALHAPEWSEGTVRFAMSGDVLTISGTGTVPQVTDAAAKAVTAIRIEKGVNGIGDFAFFHFGSLSDVAIPGSVTDIGSYAFLNCASLERVKIPEGVKRIGKNAFADCSSLSDVTIPGSVTDIGAGAFSGCTALRHAAIPSGVRSINGSVFDGCTGLSTVILPGSVSSIHDTAFFRCTGLREVYFTGTEAQWNAAAKGKLADAVMVYCNAASWSEGSVSFTLGGHTLILTGVGSAPETTREKLNPAYRIEIWEGITEIGENAFRMDQSLRELTIADSVTAIGDSAFCACTHLKTLDIPDSVTEIGDSAFSGCVSLSSVTIPESVKSIGAGAFDGCDSLRQVTIPVSVTEIGSRAFGDIHLKDVYYAGTEEQWAAVTLGENAIGGAAAVHFEA